MKVTPQTLANAIRVLSVDAVQKANSGHPGAPMGMADIAEVLWRDYLQHNPNSPDWANRDRFVLSNGHGSMLIYALLHLTGYDLSIEDLKNFRQLGSKTAGHPEYGITPGVETTTGPLGQGFANAVGMALAERSMAAEFNQPDFPIVNHHTYVFVGDGCLMEGISHEAASLAGTQRLGKLIAFYDDNGISIDGQVQGWFADDTPKRFEAYGWQVIPNVDGHDREALTKAIELAQYETGKPSLICCKTVIGCGSPNQKGTADIHGKPLGDDEIAATRNALGWTAAPFEIPVDVQAAWDAREAGAEREATWQTLFEDYQAAHPDLAAAFLRRKTGALPADWSETVGALTAELLSQEKPVATRKASELCLNVLGPRVPELLGGSADLTGSNNTKWKAAEMQSAEHPSGRYLYYGVREFGMTAIMNGMALYKGFIPFGGTFLVFMDYARNAVRLAALMKQKVVMVYTHDSIGLGEDGPTHQPIEHLASLRLMPNLNVWRPADALETAVAWQKSIENQGPSALVLTRQGLPPLGKEVARVKSIARGGYILDGCAEEPELILLATGSEVQLAIEAKALLLKSDARRQIQVVSMPSTEVFEQQEASYREQVLPSHVTARIAIEAGATGLWRQYVGLEGEVIGLDCFGESAPAKALFEHFGLTAESVVAVAERLLVRLGA